MSVEDVRIKEKSTTVGHQLEESTIKYYDVQVSTFGHWWSLGVDPKDMKDLNKALAFRDLILDTIKGRRG